MSLEWVFIYFTRDTYRKAAHSNASGIYQSWHMKKCKCIDGFFCLKKSDMLNRCHEVASFDDIIAHRRSTHQNPPAKKRDGCKFTEKTDFNQQIYKTSCEHRCESPFHLHRSKLPFKTQISHKTRCRFLNRSI